MTVPVTSRRLVLSLLAASGLALVQPMVCAAQAAAPAAAAGSPAELIAADLARDWTSQKARLVALAEAMPPEKYDFKATDGQRTFGEQLVHLSEAHVAMFKGLDASGAVPAPTLTKDHAKAAVVKALTDAYDYGAAVLKASASRLLEKPKEYTLARTVWQAMGNAQNHYGQCVVYLRLNGVVPPASRK